VNCQTVKTRRDRNVCERQRHQEIYRGQAKETTKGQDEKEKQETGRQIDIGENWIQAVRTDVNKKKKGLYRIELQ
jgi:hypothetical protein